MGADEDGTLQRLKDLRIELIDPTIAIHHGRLVKTTGDGLLVEFGSVVDALRCASDMQRNMSERNVAVPPGRRIEYRIGIHQGDIVVEDGDIFGDGVNVAARLEGLAAPGGICVSARVQEDAAGKLDLAFEDIGEQQLKNIARPVRVYRIGTKQGPGAAQGPSPLALPDKPSLAVLPFQNMTGEAEQDYFVDGIVEEITTAISRLSWLFVVARNSSFTYKGKAVDVKQVARELGVRYVLEGSVRKAGNRVRITGQLIDTAHGAHIWADRFDGTLDDIFELQDEVASQVAGAIEPKLRQSEIERAIHKPTDSLDAYDLYLRAVAQARRETEDGVRTAIALARRALVIDPSYAPAAALIGNYYNLRRARGWGSVSAAEIAEGVRLARHAIEVGKDDPEALWRGGWAIATLAGDRASGLSAIERALALNPNSAVAWNFCGHVQAYSNHPAPAIEAFERAIRLSPLDPWRWIFEGGMALAHLIAARYESALERADRALREQPKAMHTVGVKAVACTHLGRAEDGRECIRRFCELRPGSTVANVKEAMRIALSPKVLAIYVEGLRQAGLPEG
jgi:adenylate cyclase